MTPKNTIPFNIFCKRLTYNISLCVTLMCTTSITQAANYFLDNRPTSNCSDTAPDAGTETKPWCSLNKVESISLQGGDVIHLAQGATWVGETMNFDENDHDSSGLPITIQAYGGGLIRPHITSGQETAEAQRSFRGIVLKNASHWVIKDLEISHAGAGILFHYTTKSHESIRLSNLYLHHNYGYQNASSLNNIDDIQYSAGIVFTGNGDGKLTLSSNEFLVKDVVIEDIVGTRNQASIAVEFPAAITKTLDASNGKVSAMKNLTLNRLRLFQDDANGYYNQNGGCADSLRLVKVYNFTLMNSLLEDEASCPAPKGTAAIFLGYTDEGHIINNIIRNTPYLGPNVQDQGAIDLELHNTKTRIYGNLINGNKFGIECMVFGAAYPCEPYASNNAFIYNRRGAMFIKGTRKKPEGELKHNLYYAVSGSYLKWNDGTNVCQPGEINPTCTSGEKYDPLNAMYEFIATTENNVETNIPLPNPDDVYSSAGNFSNNQDGRWGYQYFDSNTSMWENLPNYEIHPTRPMWNLANGNYTLFASPFELKPTAFTGVPNSGAVARIWKAPKDGIIVIRGQLAKSIADSQGNGIKARIEQVGQQSTTQIWPVTSGDQTISAADLTGVHAQTTATVKAGDVIRFVVNSNEDSGVNDATTWAPIVAYTSGAPTMAWMFDMKDWTEYWSIPTALQSTVSLTTNAGALTATGSNIQILSRNFKTNASDNGLSGTHKFLRMRVKHNLPNTTQVVFRWTTTQNQTFDDNKSITITLNGSNDYQNIDLNLEKPNYWTDTSVITQLRIDNNDAANHSLSFDYIRLDALAPPLQ